MPAWRTLGWIPVLFVLSFNFHITETITLGGPYAIIPIAAWIGSTYGWKGIWAVLMGGLLLPLGLYFGPQYSGFHLDVFLIALIAHHIAATGSLLKNWKLVVGSKTLPVAALIFLPMKVFFYDGELIDDLPVRLGVDFYGLLMLWLFAYGAAGRRAKPIMIGLTIASVIGFTLDILDWPPRPDTILDAHGVYVPVLGLSDLRHLGVEYGLNSPVGLLTSAAYFWSGRFVNLFLKTGSRALPSPWKSYAWLCFASVFALGTWDSVLVKVLHWPPYEVFNIMGSTLGLFPVAGMAGMLLERRGIGLIVGFVGIFWWLNGLVSSGFDFADPHIMFRVEQIVYVLGFGGIGIWLRDKALNKKTFLLPRYWVCYVLLIGAILFSVLVDRGRSTDKFVLLGVCTVIFCLDAVSGHLRHRFTAWVNQDEHSGWLSFLGIVVMVSVIWQSAGVIIQNVKDLFKAFRLIYAAPADYFKLSGDYNLIIFAFIFLGSIWLFLTAIHGLIKNLPAWIEDVMRMWEGVKTVFQPNGELNVRLSPKKQLPQIQAGSLAKWLAPFSRYVRYGLLLLAVLLPLAMLIVSVYPRKGVWAELKEFYENTIELPTISREIPPQCSGGRVNRYLWQATMEYIGDKPLIEADPCGYTGIIKTDWFTNEKVSDQCLRLNFYIRKGLNESALNVYTYAKEKRFRFIWVESELEEVQEKQITQGIHARARKLAKMAAEHP